MKTRLLLFALAACGARSGLSAPLSIEDAAATAPEVDAGLVVLDAAADAEALACVLGEATEAAPVLSFPGRSANAPELVVLDPGGAGRAATVALQAFKSDGDGDEHPDIQIARLQVEASGAKIVRAPQLLGVEAHGWGHLVLAPSGLAFAWHGDPGGPGRPMFRIFDVGAWSARPALDVVPRGEAVIALASGRGASKAGGYEGEGFAVAWRDVTSGGTEARMAVLDARGSVALGPVAVAGRARYPGRSPSIAWTGSTYLAATAFGACEKVDPLCVERAVVITAVRPQSGKIEIVSSFAPERASSVYARAASHEGRTWVAWTEGDPQGTERLLRVARVDAEGKPIGAPRSLGTIAPISRLSLSVTALGVLVSWVEEGDPQLPDGAVGRSRVVARHLSLDGERESPAIVIPSRRFASYGLATSAVAVESPRAFLVTWAAHGGDRGDGGFAVDYLTRLDCR